MAGCVFCEITDGDRDAFVLHESDRAVAFLDANPAARGHSLVAPRDHHAFLFGGDGSIAEAVFRAVHRLALGLNTTLDPDGMSVFYTSAELVGSVTHAHVHVVPRFVDDGIHLSLARAELDDDAADRLTERVRAAI